MIKVFLLNFIRQMDFFQVMILIRDYLKKLDLKALKLELQGTEFETRLQAFDNSLKDSRKREKRNGCMNWTTCAMKWCRDFTGM